MRMRVVSLLACVLILGTVAYAQSGVSIAVYRLNASEFAPGEGVVETQGSRCGMLADVRHDACQIRGAANLLARPDQGSMFVGWGGACRGQASTCVPASNAAVYATFAGPCRADSITCQQVLQRARQQLEAASTLGAPSELDQGLLQKFEGGEIEAEAIELPPARDYHVGPSQSAPPTVPAQIQSSQSVKGAVAELPPATGRVSAAYSECRTMAADGNVSAAELPRWTALNCRKHY